MEVLDFLFDNKALFVASPPFFYDAWAVTCYNPTKVADKKIYIIPCSKVN